MKSAGAGSASFWFWSRYGKCGNTGRIFHFSYRRPGAKDPLPSRRRFIQSFLYSTELSGRILRTAAAAAPTSMPQARPRSAMSATQAIWTWFSPHSSANGRVKAGSAFSARYTRTALPARTAFFSCLAPTATCSREISGKSPHSGILPFCFLSIRDYIIRVFRKKSTKLFQNFL